MFQKTQSKNDIMKKTVVILLFWIVAIPSGFAQLRTYSFEEAEKLGIENPRPTFVFIHTSWCKYCKMMEHSTFKNPEVIRLLNEKFYFVSLDAESKKQITYNKHTFEYKPKGQNTGVHELAEALGTLDGVVSYPSIVVLDTNQTILYQQSSYIDSRKMLVLLKEITKRH
jgi:thioredoxin-related protein